MRVQLNQSFKVIVLEIQITYTVIVTWKSINYLNNNNNKNLGKKNKYRDFEFKSRLRIMKPEG